MRAKKPKLRKPQPDARYGSEQLQRFINKLMLDGKKDLAARIVYEAIEQAGEQLNVEPLVVFETALKNVAPTIEVRSRRVGGATFQVPMPVRTERKEMLATRWIINSARSRNGKDMSTLLMTELVSAFNGEGEAIKMRDNVHKMAEANRAFAHFKW